MWIEIFKSGVHTDSSGRERNFSGEDISAIAEKYNESTASDKSGEAPVVLGHPKDNTPAYGWVERLARRGEILLAKLKNLSPELIEEVRQGSFKKVSISLYPDLMLRHVGLLGGAAPSVKGLRNISFSGAENFEIVSYFTQKNNLTEAVNENPSLIEKITFLENENKSILRKLEEKEKTIHKLLKDAKSKEFMEFVNSATAARNGMKLTPAQSDALVNILEMIYVRGLKKIETDDINQSDFSENEDLIEKIKSFVTGLTPAFSTDEFAVRQITREKPDYHSFTGKKVQPERLLLHNKALEILNENPAISYEEAIFEAQS